MSITHRRDGRTDVVAPPVNDEALRHLNRVDVLGPPANRQRRGARIAAWTTATMVAAAPAVIGAARDSLFSSFAVSHDVIWGFAAADTTWPDTADEIVTEIGRLPQGWAGPASVVPSTDTLDDIGHVIGYLPPNFRRPLIEIDEDEGDVTLSWMSADQRRMFSLHFHGTHNVIGSYTSLDSGESHIPWKFGVAEESKILDKLDSEKVRNILSA
jgi:hypothetical protein